MDQKHPVVTRIEYRSLCSVDTFFSVCGKPTYTLVDGEPMCASCRKYNGIKMPKKA